VDVVNTTNNTKHNKIKIGEWCGGVTAVKDKIYIGGSSKVLILNTDGSRVREITSDGFNNNLLYNKRNDQLLLRHKQKILNLQLK
jgi:hypothetical protein